MKQIMRIAILGATSQIAKDLVLSFAAHANHELRLFARRPETVKEWMSYNGLSNLISVSNFDEFGVDEQFVAILNFVGVGNPAQAVAMGASIFDATLKYDEMALNYLSRHPDCRYVFLSSGAAYGSNFEQPVDGNNRAVISINHLQPQEWYAVAKLHAECRHRSLPHLPIVDVRVFNYFSHTQDISARFFITDILRAIQSGETLITSSDNIVRDYIGPDDFFKLVSLILAQPPINEVVDCYTQAPVDKMTLLTSMNDRFGLRYEVSNAPAGVNATGVKMNYYSNNRRAEGFGYVPSKNSLQTVLDEAFLALSPASTA
jgi:nucleoside-diphosphate-sugar epimerase